MISGAHRLGLGTVLAAGLAAWCQADPNLSDAQNVQKGTELSKKGQHQKAYDLYLKDLSPSPRNTTWLMTYVRRFNVVVSSKASDQEILKNGTNLAKAGQHQKAYDLYFNQLSQTPKNQAWLESYRKRFHIIDPEGDISTEDMELIRHGSVLSRRGQHQEAYDQYFKKLSSTPYYQDWLKRYRKRHNLILEEAVVDSPEIRDLDDLELFEDKAPESFAEKEIEVKNEIEAEEKLEVVEPKLLEPKSNPKIEPAQLPARAGVLLGLNAIVGLSSWVAVIIQREAVEDYNDLYSKFNDTTLSNYLLLVSERNSLETKTTVARNLGIAAGALIGYTILDMVLLHSFFPRKISTAMADNKFQLAVDLKF